MAVDDSALEPLVTECPNCSTRFRVTEGQLQVAHGRVRCGACLTVFQGTDHLFLDGEPYTPGTESFSKLDDELDELLDELSGAPSRSKTPDSVPGMASSPGNASPDSTAPDLASLNLSARGADDDFDSDDIPAELAALEEELMRGLREESLMPAAREPHPPVEFPRDALTPPVADDVVEIQDVADYTTVAGTTAAPTVPSETSAPEPETVSDVVPETDVVALAELAELAAIVDVAQAAQSAEIAADVPGETEETADAQRADRTDAATDSNDAAIDWVDDVDDNIWQGVAEESAGSSQPATGPDNQTPVQVGASVAAPQVLGRVEREVLEEAELEEPAAPRPWITYLLILVALVGLPVQVLWYQFEDWSVDPQVRPVYAFVCDMFECQLPQMTDIGRIESKDKIVRSHPDVADALIVDLLIVNNAEFAQQFPIIELTFTSLQGALIAGRRFKPEEYLTGELSASELFAPRTPVHVSLEVEDPGETAVNYNINFR